MAADIEILPLTTVNEYVEGAIQNLPQFQLLSYADDASIILAAGPTEEVGGFYYRVTGGDLAVTDAVGNGTVYIHIKDDGDGTASAYLSVNAGTYDPNKGGYYHTDGAKVIFKMDKTTGPIYSNKTRRINKGSPLEYYSTGWINRSDWTDVNPGSNITKNTDSNVAHNLDTNLSGLLIKFLISTDSTDNNSSELGFQTFQDTAFNKDFGLRILQVDSNNFKIQTGADGVALINDTTGAWSIELAVQDWYYKVVVFKLIN